MKVYHKNDIVIATHTDDAAPDPSVYGEGVSVTSYSNDVVLQREGVKPVNPLLDSRPYVMPKLTLDELKAAAKKDLITKINEIYAKNTSVYPEVEMLSWGTKEAAARLSLAGSKLNDSQSAMLEAEKTAGSYNSIKELCESIVNKADAFMVIAGTLSGVRSDFSQKIDNATTESALAIIMSNLVIRLKNSLNIEN
jgi:hypothetical protein